MIFKWVSLKYSGPSEITEAQYRTAREHPDELKRVAWDNVRPLVQTVGIIIGVTVVGGAVCAFLPSTFEGLENILIQLAVVLFASAVLSFGSLVYFLTSLSAYWRALIQVADESNSYPAFLTSWTTRKNRGIGLDRKLSWWVPWLILAVFLVALYAICKNMK